jgi:hypothetical protein
MALAPLSADALVAPKMSLLLFCHCLEETALKICGGRNLTEMIWIALGG